MKVEVYHTPYELAAANDYVYDQFAWELRCIPGDSSVEYVKPIDPPLGEGYLSPYFKISTKTSNTLVLGVSSDNSSYITKAKNIYSFKAQYSNTYNISYEVGVGLNILLALSCLDRFITPSEYDVSKLNLTSIGLLPTIIQFGGTDDKIMAPDTYKVWRLSYTPEDILPEVLNIGFATKDTDAITTFNNMRINSIYGDYLADSNRLNSYSYPSDAITTITLTKIPSKYSYSWQKVLADSTYKTLTTGTSTVTTSQEVVGPLSIGGSISSNLCLRNITEEPIIITSVVVTISTLQLNFTKAGLTKDQVLDDFSVSIIDNGLETLFPAFTATALSKTLTLAKTLDSLKAIHFKVIYHPRLKVLPHISMIAPYNPLTVSSIVNSINTNRRVSITVKGYLASAPTVPITFGNSLIIKGGISNAVPALVPSCILSNLGGLVVDEGAIFKVSVTTTNVEDGASFNYIISGANITDKDTPLLGTVYIYGGKAIINHHIYNDYTTEGSENLTLTLLGSSINLIINDTSLTPLYNLDYSPIPFKRISTTIALVISDALPNVYVKVTKLNDTTIIAEGYTSPIGYKVFYIKDTVIDTSSYNVIFNNGEVSKVLTITSTPIPEEYLFIPSASNWMECSSNTLTIIIKGIETGVSIPYAITGVSSEYLGNIPLTGTILISDYILHTEVLTFNIGQDYLPDDRVLAFTINTTGDFIEIPISSSTPQYNFNSDADTISESETVVITLNTYAIPDGTLVPYVITGVTQNDISVPLEGTFIIHNNTTTLAITALSDGLVESSELLTLTISSGAFIDILIV